MYDETRWSLTIIDLDEIKGDSPERAVCTTVHGTCEKAVAAALERMDRDQRFKKGETNEMRESLDGGGCVQHGNKIYTVEEQIVDSYEADDRYFEDYDEDGEDEE